MARHGYNMRQDSKFNVMVVNSMIIIIIMYGTLNLCNSVITNNFVFAEEHQIWMIVKSLKMKFSLLLRLQYNAMFVSEKKLFFVGPNILKIMSV